MLHSSKIAVHFSHYEGWTNLPDLRARSLISQRFPSAFASCPQCPTPWFSWDMTPWCRGKKTYGTQGRRFWANVPLTNLTWANCSTITTLHPEKVAIESWATHSNGWQYMFLKFRYGQKPKTWGLFGRVQEVFGWLFCSKRGKRMKHAETKTPSRI